MKSRVLYRHEDSFKRVIKEDKERIFVIDCVARTMPKWGDKGLLEGYEECEEEDFLMYVGKSFIDEETISQGNREIMKKRLSIVLGILPYIYNDDLRSQAIHMAMEEHKISKQTIRSYLCEYLAFNDERALLPKERGEKPMSKDEKNMRWALNKFYYTINKNTLKNAYTMMLKEKYCDGEGKLFEEYPSYHQFRYFFRKTKSIQKMFISREGLVSYQRNLRPLLGDGVREYAPCIGSAMLDSTICDIFLVNEARQLIGRPILTSCIDVYSGMCLGYSLTLEGGMYSLRDLMLNVVSDKREHCMKYGITIEEEEWSVKGELPTRLITDKGVEYKGANFEQISELGVSLVNLPPYRPELKGCVERFFDCVQGYYKPFLKGRGVIEVDYQERGRHDYRKDASLTLEQFEKVILHCILFYNTKRVLNEFPYTEDMLEEGVKPYPNVIWNMGKSQGDELIRTTPKDLVKTLLPRVNGSFRRKGLMVNGLRYKNSNYNEAYLQGNDVIVAYNPEDVNVVWLLENGKYVEFELIESRFKDKEVEDVKRLKQRQSELCTFEQKNMTQGEIDLANKILAIRDQAKERVHTLKDVSVARQVEKERHHKDYVREVM